MRCGETVTDAFAHSFAISRTKCVRSLPTVISLMSMDLFHSEGFLTVMISICPGAVVGGPPPTPPRGGGEGRTFVLAAIFSRSHASNKGEFNKK